MEPRWRVGRADGAVRRAGRTPNALDGSSVDDSCSRSGGAIFQGAEAQGRRTLLPSPAQRPQGSLYAPRLTDASGRRAGPQGCKSQEPHVASSVQQCLTEALGNLVL
jgi:hypothetical protein